MKKATFCLIAQTLDGETLFSSSSVTSRPRAAGAPAGTPRWLSPGEPPAANKNKERRKKKKKTWPRISRARIWPQAQIALFALFDNRWNTSLTSDTQIGCYNHSTTKSEQVAENMQFVHRKEPQGPRDKSSSNMWILIIIPVKQQRGRCECNNLRVPVCRDSYAKYQDGTS